jgi:MiaB-like tRNA modifying enzyme
MMSGILEHSGYTIVDRPEDADVNVLVTCTVKSVTQDRMEHRIKELSDNKAASLVVAGCFPKVGRDRIEKINDRASLMGPNSIHKTLQVVEDAVKGQKLVILEDPKNPKVLLPRTRKNSIVGIVEISSGCLSGCTFCQVKLIKGVLFSYPKQQIIQEVRNSVAQGCKEIWLTSTDNSCYGWDIKTNLAQLVQEVCRVEGDFFVRVGMMNPLLTSKILDELIEAYQNPKVFKFAHLPAQSGSDRILGMMRRGYSVEDFVSIVEKFRDNVPRLTLSTDIIVGFPGETENDFDRTLDLSEEVEPDVVNLSRYGARPGTVAATMENQIPPTETNRRSQIASKLCREIALKKNQAWVDWRGEALVDEFVSKAVVARNFAYKPIVVRDDRVRVGKKIEVGIVGATSSTISGRVTRFLQ